MIKHVNLSLTLHICKGTNSHIHSTIEETETIGRSVLRLLDFISLDLFLVSDSGCCALGLFDLIAFDLVGHFELHFVLIACIVYFFEGDCFGIRGFEVSDGCDGCGCRGLLGVVKEEGCCC